MRLSQRNVTLMMMFGILLATIASAIFLVVTSDIKAALFSPTAAGVVLSLAIFLLYRSGWEPARYLFLAMIVILVGLSLDNNPVPAFYILLPPALGIIMVGPPWIFLSAVGVYLIGMVRSNYSLAYTNPVLIIVFLIIAFAMAIGRHVIENSEREAASNAARAEENARRAQAQAEEIAQANTALAGQLQQQQQLLDLVATLETPAVPLVEGVLLAPIIGNIDTRRSQILTNHLLDLVHKQRVKLVIIDIAGVATVDTAVAKALLSTAMALRLLGCQVAISGISAEIAMTLTNQHIDLQGVLTVRSPQEALANYQF